MEHYRSTLATAAVAAFGLVAAAHILHPGNYQDLPRQVRASVVNAEAPASAMVWVDPPARASTISVLSDATITAAQAAEAGLTQAPQPTATTVAETPVPQPNVQEARASGDQLRKLEAPRRHRVAQRKTRMHQASLTRSAPKTPVLDEQASASETAPKTAERFDPIGSLIHGLGLDS